MTLKQLVKDKNEIIVQQKSIIESCKCKSNDHNKEITDLQIKLEEAIRIISERDANLSELEESPRNTLKKLNVDHDQRLEERVMELLHLNEVLRKEVDAQITITKKAEESFSTQYELVKTKEELIQNQKL